MEQTFPVNPLLDLLACPAFCVHGGTVVQANRAASDRFIQVGASVEEYLGQDAEAYRDFSGGCLFLTLTMMEVPCGAAVTRMEGFDLFQLENAGEDARQALALAAQQLRQPLNTVYTLADSLRDGKQSAQIQQGLNQMHRIICNMSDLSRYEERSLLQSESTNLTALFTEVVEKAQTLLATAGVRLEYTALPEAVMGMADREMLERAVHNLLSNAVKFSPPQGVVRAKLIHRGNTLQFTVTDQGDGIPQDILRQVFSRYLRQPALEDSRHGMGIGLALVCRAANYHKGTVLIDRPADGGTRVTMTIRVTPCADDRLHSPIKLLSYDYAGGHDHGLLELAELLPDSAYRKENLSHTFPRHYSGAWESF